MGQPTIWFVVIFTGTITVINLRRNEAAAKLRTDAITAHQINTRPFHLMPLGFEDLPLCVWLQLQLQLQHNNSPAEEKWPFSIK